MFLKLDETKSKELFDIELDKFKKFKAQNLSLSMARGKPSFEQLDLSIGLLDVLNSSTEFLKSSDYRNYGILDGIKEIKEVFCDYLNVSPDEIIVAENASLKLMYDNLQRAMQFGVLGTKPWNAQEKIKWLCPVPGYDRHFAITELFGIEMINIDMDENGPNMDLIEEYIKDASVKGIWCVPKYSNPSGVVYSDEVVERFARLKPAAKDFRIFWDNAYMSHYLYEDDILLDLLAESKKHNNENLPYIFGSTSKITFAGAGISFLVSSKENINSIKKLMSLQSIGPDKLNQYAHALFFKNHKSIESLMRSHADLLRPKFEAVISIFEEEFAHTGLAKWINPRGGYFISCDLLPGLAKRSVEIAHFLGVEFTPAGSTFPYKKDPEDSNLRIAPSFPALDELKVAMRVFATAVKLAFLEKKLGLNVFNLVKDQ